MILFEDEDRNVEITIALVRNRPYFIETTGISSFLYVGRKFRVTVCNVNVHMTFIRFDSTHT